MAPQGTETIDFLLRVANGIPKGLNNDYDSFILKLDLL